MKNIDGILTYAKDEKIAVEEALEVKRVKIDPIRNGMPRYYPVDSLKAMLEQDQAEEWLLSMPRALRVSTSLSPTNDSRGLKLVLGFMEDNRKAFMQSMEHIRHYLEQYSDDELYFELECKSLITGLGNLDRHSHIGYWCGIVSGYSEYSEPHLFDHNGNAIWCQQHLDCMLNPSYLSLHSLANCDSEAPDRDKRAWTLPLWLTLFIREHE